MKECYFCKTKLDDTNTPKERSIPDICIKCVEDMNNLNTYFNKLPSSNSLSDKWYIVSLNDSIKNTPYSKELLKDKELK